MLRRISSGRRILGSEALLVALLLLAPIMAGLHASEEPHVLCLEHQRVEHADAAHSVEEGNLADLEATGAQIAADHEESETHQGCSLEPSLRERSFMGSGAPAATGPLTLDRRSAALRAAYGHVQVSLLRLAPKQSPPV